MISGFQTRGVGCKKIRERRTIILDTQISLNEADLRMAKGLYKQMIIEWSWRNRCG